MNTPATTLDTRQCEWTSVHLPIELHSLTVHPAVNSLGLGIRQNPRRAHLIVSPPLAKHVAISPSIAVDAANALADEAIHTGEAPDAVIGFAETATGLSRLVADRVAETHPGVFYAHSTRTEDGPEGWFFSEPHSHAATHRVALAAPEGLNTAGVIWLVDDEVTSGNTTANVIRELHHRTDAHTINVVCLVDARQDREVGPLADIACETGLCVSVISLARVAVEVKPDALEAATQLVADTKSNVLSVHTLPQGHRRLPNIPDHTPAHTSCADLHDVTVSAPITRDRHGVVLPNGEVVDTGRRIVEAIGSVLGQATARASAGDTTQAGAAQSAVGLATAPTVHIVGVEEQIAVAVRTAEILDADGFATTVSTTTRSPALAVDDAGYPLRSAITWPAADAPRFAYNIPDADVVVVVPDFDSEVTEAHREAFRVALSSSQVVIVTWR